jgi:hypothetical protein
MSGTDANLADPAEPTPTAPEFTPRPRIGVGFPGVVLVLPVVAGVALFFGPSFNVAFAISLAMVLATSTLMAVDARRLGRIDSSGHDAGSAVVLFLAMCLLWIVGYPYAFYRRARFERPNLTIPAVVIALFFVGGPVLYAVLVPPGLPTCTSSEVVRVLDEVIRKSSIGATLKSVDGFHELSFDREANVRHGQCVVHTNARDIDLQYIVRWLNRDARQFEVRLTDAEVPSCAGPEVIQLLNQIVRKTPVGAQAKSVDGFREVSFDREANTRLGQCIVHTKARDIEVRYLVRWLDRDTGQFEVRITEPEVPSCTSPEVVQVLNQVIRKTAAGAQAKSIDGFREVSFDPKANTRQGRCVVHTNGGNIDFQYLIKWTKADEGRFEVKAEQVKP